MALDGSDFFVRLIDFPTCTAGGMVLPNDDGTYSVYLNARTSFDQQRRAYRHEVDHIDSNDLYNGKSIKEVEGF